VFDTGVLSFTDGEIKVIYDLHNGKVTKAQIEPPAPPSGTPIAAIHLPRPSPPVAVHIPSAQIIENTPITERSETMKWRESHYREADGLVAKMWSDDYSSRSRTMNHDIARVEKHRFIRVGSFASANREEAVQWLINQGSRR